jgi:ABC-type glycerol-3-phosphate transport system substrate-binding protein
MNPSRKGPVSRKSTTAPRLLLCLAIALVPASRAAPEKTQSTSSIDVWSWNIAAASLQSLLPTFKERHPDINVRINATGTNMQSRFLLSLVAGVGAPDISQLEFFDAPKFHPSGRMMDLTEVAKKYEKSFSPAFWANCVHEGRIYAIPWDMGPCAVFYKRDIFERYAIDPEAIKTWDDYIEAGKTILEASDGQTHMMGATVSDYFAYFEILIQQTGGGVFDTKGRINVNSAENIRALEVLRALLDSGVVAPIAFFSPECLASFKNKALATYPTAVWFGGTIKDNAKSTAGNWGVFRLPAIDPGGLRTSNLGGSVLVIPEQGENKEAAWTFVEHALCTKEGQLAQFKGFDLFPCLMTTFDDPFFDEPDPFFGDQKIRRLFATDIEKLPTLIRTRDWNEAKRYISQSLSRWADEHLDHAEFLATCERKLCRKLGREAAPKGDR